MTKYTVSELNKAIKDTLDSEFGRTKIKVLGEISSIKHSGGHTFLTLKDDSSSMDVAFWHLEVDGQQGDDVEVSGEVSFYERGGKINIKGKSIKNVGVGALHEEYEKLKARYKKKGYFDRDRKKPQPKTVKNIGVVTAEKGDVLQDFKYVLKKNSFQGDVYFYNCLVQGEKCPQTVTEGIKFFSRPFYTDSNNIENIENKEDFGKYDVKDKNLKNNKKKRKKIDNNTIDPNNSDDVEIEVDIIVVMRGGGSFEDLMGFSDERVLEALHTSTKYTISAIGHQTDEMLSDLVADCRAPTPSIAGELVCSISNEKNKHLSEMKIKLDTIKSNLLQRMSKYRKIIQSLQQSIFDPTEEINRKFNDAERISMIHIKSIIDTYKRKLAILREILNENDADKMLNNGFILFTDEHDNIVTSIENMFNKKITMIHSSGRYDVVVKHPQ